MHCPRCDVPIPPEALVDDVGQCPGCGQVFDAQLSPTAPALGPADPPYGVIQRPHEAGVELVLPWRHDAGFPWHVSTLGGVVLFSLCGWVPGLSQTLVVICWGGAALTLARWVCMMVNRTIVVVAPVGIDVRNGPLPTLAFGGTVPMSQLRMLTTERTTSETVQTRWGSRARNWHHWQIAVGTQGDALLSGWQRREGLDHVRKTIDAYARQGAQRAD